MYEVIKHYLKKWFGQSLSEKEILFVEFEIIVKELNEAITLAQLFNVRTKISAYTQAVKHIGNPPWAKNKVNILSAHWNRRYRLWKKSRGSYGTHSQNKKVD
jgi:hypothetical protein